MTAADKLDKVDRLLDDASRATADREHGLAIGCTEWQAAWCPIHGDCCCENGDEWKPGTNGCKLHLAEKTPVKKSKVYDEEGKFLGYLKDIDLKFDLSWFPEGSSITVGRPGKYDCSGLVTDIFKGYGA